MFAHVLVIAADSVQALRGLEYELLPGARVRKELPSTQICPLNFNIFESKNLTGTIIGDIDRPKWLIYHNSPTPHYFVNPLQQNIGHINALFDYLGAHKRPLRFFSIVVFGVDTYFRYVPMNTDMELIFSARGLYGKLKKFLLIQPSYYSPEVVERLYQKLLPCENVSSDVKHAHVERITRKFGRIN